MKSAADCSRSGVKMFLRVVILAFAATCCTARVIDVTELQNAWERSGKFEGDIMLTELQMRNGLIHIVRRWPNKTVPFFIDPVFTTADVTKIMQAVDEYHSRTSIRLVRQNSPPTGDYVYITGENSGCWSYVGRIGGRQNLNLQRNGCLTKGTIIHELLHALGFYHQQSATERDDYVTILWNNIEAGKEHNFDKYDANTITSFGVLYDYGSIMHYSAYAFSSNGQKTIQTKDPKAQIGQTSGFSTKDIQKLELMYQNVY